MKHTLKNLFSLPNQVKIYIPATKNINEATDNQKTKLEAIAKFSKWYGGASAHPITGGWISDKMGLVTEAIECVYANATDEAKEAHESHLIAYAMKLKKDYTQEAVAIEVNGIMYLV